MAIHIYLGGVGSGKTACAVRQIILNKDKRKYYSNIAIKDKKVEKLKAEHIIKKVVKEYKKGRKDGELTPVYEYDINLDYWKSQKEPLCIVIDEVHNIANARTSMSRKNRIFNTWLTMIRRVLSSAETGYGDLILISQLSNQIDIIARQLSHNIRFHVCHYRKTCRSCSYTWGENSEMPEPLLECPRCSHYKLVKHSHMIEVWHFKGMDMFEAYKDFGVNTYYRHYFINDIEDYFGYYNTLQWDNLFEEV